jgi:hypothetical protein
MFLKIAFIKKSLNVNEPLFLLDQHVETLEREHEHRNDHIDYNKCEADHGECILLFRALRVVTESEDKAGDE